MPTDANSGQGKPWIPETFDVPLGLENEHFRLRPLTIHDVVKDYDAVMSSREQLRGVFGPDDDWPRDDLSLEQNLIDLGWHQKEFQRRSSFAYTVVSHDEERVLGCVYILPSTRVDFDAEIILWVRADKAGDGYDARLYEAVRDWVEDVWLFRKPAYPGRNISWELWGALGRNADRR